MRYSVFFMWGWNEISGIQYVFYTYRVSHYRLVKFQVLHGTSDTAALNKTDADHGLTAICHHSCTSYCLNPEIMQSALLGFFTFSPTTTFSLWQSSYLRQVHVLFSLLIFINSTLRNEKQNKLPFSSSEIEKVTLE